MNRKSLGINPLLKELSKKNIEYYWTVDQSEWATDIMFKSEEALESIYTPLLSGAISTFGSDDVMRFLGKRLCSNYNGEVLSDLKKRKEGFRIKHIRGKNSVKMYDKANSLRVETTINDLTIYRIEDEESEDEKGETKIRKMRKGVSDIVPRTEISQECNERYLESLASLKVTTPIKNLIDPICKPKIVKNRRARAIRPNSEKDLELFEIINRGENNINGFQNRDVLTHLYPDLSEEEKPKFSRKISQKLWILRAHGLIKKLPRSNRYIVGKDSRKIVAAILGFRNVSLAQLTAA